MIRLARRIRSLIALLALAAPASHSAAQAVLVRAVDAASGRPLTDAVVALLDADGTARAQAATDTAGQRLLRAPSAGVFRVSLQRAGFAALTSEPITVVAGGTVSVELRGHAAGTGPTNVGASRGSLLRAEFEERRRLGAGYALGVRELRHMPTMRSAFEAIPVVLVEPDDRSAFDFRVLMRGDVRGTCSPAIWVDGMRGAQEMLSSINLSDVLGIEAYRRFGSAPARYQSGNTRCGVILIWTNFPA